MYPGVTAIPAQVRQGALTRPRFRGVRHLSECCGESVYAAKFRGMGAADARDAADREAVELTLAPAIAADAARTARLVAEARASAAPGVDAARRVAQAGYREVTPARALSTVNASLDRADGQRVRVAVAQRDQGNSVPVMVNGILAMADAGSDPRVAAARAAELRASYRAPAPVNPLGLALTAPSPADMLASAEFTPEIPNSQAAVRAAITAKARSPFGLGADPDVPPTSPAPTSPLKNPIVLGALALGAFLMLRGH